MDVMYDATVSRERGGSVDHTKDGVETIDTDAATRMT
jgi:hypothetical protein